MKNFLIAFTVFIVWSVFGLWLYSWMQNDKEDSGSETEIAINEVDDDLEEIPIDTTYIEEKLLKDQKFELEVDEHKNDNWLKAINIEGDYVFLYSEGISAEINSADIMIPKSSIDFKYKLFTYLIEHPDQELHIHSIYSPVEHIVSPNLGVQRGNKLKEILIDVGIPNNRIVIKPIIKGIDLKDDDWTKNIIYFTFNPLNEDRANEIKIIPKSKIIYPKYSISGILVNDELKALLEELKLIMKTILN
jgi:hypothetical protein